MFRILTRLYCLNRMMLRLGSSKPWNVSLEAITGQSSMNTRAIRRYFAPLLEWLKRTNTANGDEAGWTS